MHSEMANSALIQLKWCYKSYIWQIIKWPSTMYSPAKLSLKAFSCLCVCLVIFVQGKKYVHFLSFPGLFLLLYFFFVKADVDSTLRFLLYRFL